MRVIAAAASLPWAAVHESCCRLWTGQHPTSTLRSCSCLIPCACCRPHTYAQLPGLHPMTTPDDNNLAEEIMKADPTLRRLLAERYGIIDMDKVACDTW